MGKSSGTLRVDDRGGLLGDCLRAAGPGDQGTAAARAVVALAAARERNFEVAVVVIRGSYVYTENQRVTTLS